MLKGYQIRGRFVLAGILTLAIRRQRNENITWEILQRNENITWEIKWIRKQILEYSPPIFLGISLPPSSLSGNLCAVELHVP
jgi:hypothetical protein